MEHKIELDIMIPPLHQTCYHMNPNHVAVVKQDFDKLLVVRFIKPMEHVTWLSLIVVVPNKNGKLIFALIFGS
jgi:hypothetical protein